MGLRGPGAARRRAVTREAESVSRPLPWLKPRLSRAERVVRFLEWLPITKGPFTGRKMKLLSEQREFIRAIYGDLDKEGLRKRRIGIKSEPKGNGKTGLCAGLVLCHLL